MFRGDGPIAESSFDVASLPDRRDLSSAAAGSLSSPAAGPLYSGGTFLPRRWERLSSSGELGSYSSSLRRAGILVARCFTLVANVMYVTPGVGVYICTLVTCMHLPKVTSR